MTNRPVNGQHAVADRIEEGSWEKVRRPVVPGMEDILSGHVLGQYRLMERLGRGGMATVYKAYQPSLDRYVAVKVLSTFLAQDPDFAARFQREARAIAQLNHPNILPVHDYGQEGDLIYIVMRYVEGGTLQDILGRPLDLDTAVKIIAQMGGALDYAHQRGIVHRDVKPSNILMADRNWALLGDFGLARMVGASTRITQTGVGMGTPAYIAPEQAQGTGVDARSDIYSLGVVLFEMLTGQVPFAGDTSLVVLLKHLKEPPPPPGQINPDIPEPVERVLLKALAKDPRDRFRRAGEMVTALQQAMTGGPVVTAAISLAEEREREQEKLAALYAEAVAFLKNKEWQKALEKWVEIQAIDPTYTDSQQVAATARRELARLEAAATPLELRLPATKESVPLWRKVPGWVWAALGGAILLSAVMAGTIWMTSPKAGESVVLVSPTSTPEPPTLTPTVAVGATQTALAALAADVIATALAQASATMGASMPAPTETLMSTPTPVPTTATATHTPAPPPPTPVPTAMAQLAGSTSLTIYLRDAHTRAGFAALSADQPYGWNIYEEGRFVYGEAAVSIGNTTILMRRTSRDNYLTPGGWNLSLQRRW